MKRILCSLLTVSLLLAYSGAMADQHYEIQGIFSGKPGGKIVSFDLYESNDKLVTVSSLFPDIAIIKSFENSNPPLSGADWIFDITPESVISVIEKTSALTDEWLAHLKPESYKGIYSGEFFDDASDMICYEFSLSDYRRYILDHCQAETDGDLETQRIVRYFAGMPDVSAALDDMTALVRAYQENRYMTVLLMEQDNILMTLSLDRSCKEKKHALISYRTDGKYCFRDIEILYDGSGLTLLSSMYVGSSSVYTMYTGQAPLFRESLTLTVESDKSCGFHILFEADKLSNPLQTKGSISGTKNGYKEIKATVCIVGDESAVLDLSVYPEEIYRDVSFSDKKILRAENDDNDEIRTSLLSGTLALVSDILPSLPADYQDIFFTLFFK